MWVEVVVAIAGVVFAGAFLCFAWWGLTRAKDRLQLATVCLLLCTLGYGTLAAGATLHEGPTRAISLVAGFYAVVLYAVMSVLAVRHSRWAWRASIAAFGIHIALTLVALPTLLHAGRAGMIAIALGLAVGGLGLWACLHKGSRELVASAA